jgi:predicted O-methyltransferase YrrM
MPAPDNADAEDTTGHILDYINARYASEDEVLRDLLEAARMEGLPSIQVSPSLGKFLALLVRISGARRILEIGTLAGYSAIWLGRALPENGTLITLEIDPRHAAVAQRFIARAALDEKIEVRLGPALQTLEYLAGGLPFDMVFIDANKESYPAYLDWALRLVRPGGLIVADNVLRDGAVLDTTTADAAVQAIQTYNDRVSRDPRLDGVIMVTRNGGGHRDGVSVAWVRDDVDPSDDLYHRE